MARAFEISVQAVLPFKFQKYVMVFKQFKCEKG